MAASTNSASMVGKRKGVPVAHHETGRVTLISRRDGASTSSLTVLATLLSPPPPLPGAPRGTAPRGAGELPGAIQARLVDHHRPDPAPQVMAAPEGVERV